VDRLRCIGNGQVPSVVALAWNTLAGWGDVNMPNAPAHLPPASGGKVPPDVGSLNQEVRHGN
jgi:hypothetical protein